MSTRKKKGKKIKPNARPCPVCKKDKKYKNCCGSKKGKKDSTQVIQKTSYIASEELFDDFLKDLHSMRERLSFLFTIMSYIQQDKAIQHINKLMNQKIGKWEELLQIRARLLKIQNNSLGWVTWADELDAEHTEEEFGSIMNELTGNLVRDIKQMTSEGALVPQIIKSIELIGVYLKLSEFSEANSVCKLVIKQVQGKTNLKDFYYIAMMFSAHSKNLFAQIRKEGDMETLYEEMEAVYEMVLPKIGKKMGKKHLWTKIIEGELEKSKSGKSSGETKVVVGDVIVVDEEIELFKKLMKKLDGTDKSFTFNNNYLQELIQIIDVLQDHPQKFDDDDLIEWGVLIGVTRQTLFNNMEVDVEKINALDKSINEGKKDLKVLNEKITELKTKMDWLTDSPSGLKIRKETTLLLKNNDQDKKVLETDIESAEDTYSELKDDNQLYAEMMEKVDFISNFFISIGKSRIASYNAAKFTGELTKKKEEEEEEKAATDAIEEKRRKKEKDMVRLKKKAREAKEKKEEDDEEDRREEQSKLDKRAVLYQKKAAADAASDAAAEEAAVEERKREEERKRDEGGKREEEREKKEMVKLANSDPINLKTYQEIKDYMEAVLYVLREQEGVSPEQEKNERTKSEGLFEDNKSEIASLVADISKKFDRFIFVVVGGAAVKAHHATESRTGHKTTDFDIKVYPTEELGYSVDSKEGKTWVARSRFDIFKALKTWEKEELEKADFKFSILKGIGCDDDFESWEEAEERGEWITPCGLSYVPIKVSLKIRKEEVEEKKEEKWDYFPLLEFSFSPTALVIEDYSTIQMPKTSTPLNYFTLEKLKQVLKDNITKAGGFMARIAAKEPNVYRKKILSWLKQLNSLNTVELRREESERAPVTRSGFELKVGGTRKKYRKKYKTRRIKKKSRKRTKKKRCRKKSKSRKK